MRVLVTGGGGFLGEAIVGRCLERGDEVRSYSRGHYPDLEARGVEIHTGDLTDLSALQRAAEGCQLVFHVAARVGVWGPYEEYHEANVTGTEHVIQVCREHGIGRLVYTSSPSVVYDGSDQEGIDESVPYPEHFLAHYPRTKAIGERRVLDANDDGLRTVALRPHLIWGPGDRYLVPRIIERARSGKLRLLGHGAAKVDSVYIDNAADAHLLAANRLEVGSPAAGRAYFISNGEPLPMAELINRILAAAHLPPVTRSIPTAVAIAAGTVAEGVCRLLRLRDEPRITRFVAKQLSTAHWFDLSAARNDLGYEPRVSLEEGFSRLERWFQTGSTP